MTKKPDSLLYSEISYQQISYQVVKAKLFENLEMSLWLVTYVLVNEKCPQTTVED